MPVPCQTPCEMCGDEQCLNKFKFDFSSVPLLNQAELFKKLGEIAKLRNVSDFKTELAKHFGGKKNDTL